MKPLNLKFIRLDYCDKHNSPALGRCPQCQRPLCMECRLHLSRRYGFFCSRGCARIYARLQALKHWSKIISRLLALLLIVLFGIHFLQETYPCLRPYDLLGRCWP